MQAEAFVPFSSSASGEMPMHLQENHTDVILGAVVASRRSRSLGGEWVPGITVPRLPGPQRAPSLQTALERRLESVGCHRSQSAAVDAVSLSPTVPVSRPAMALLVYVRRSSRPSSIGLASAASSPATWLNAPQLVVGFEFGQQIANSRVPHQQLGDDAGTVGRRAEQVGH